MEEQQQAEEGPQGPHAPPSSVLLQPLHVGRELLLVVGAAAYVAVRCGKASETDGPVVSDFVALRTPGGQTTRCQTDRVSYAVQPVVLDDVARKLHMFISPFL
jgi:hypothetical protein